MTEIKKKRGRPPGSKNKKTLEREAQVKQQIEQADEQKKEFKPKTCAECDKPLPVKDHFHTTGWNYGLRNVCCPCAKKLFPNWTCGVEKLEKEKLTTT